MTFKILLFLAVCFIGTGNVMSDDTDCSSGSSASCGSNQICCNRQCVYGTDCAGRSCDHSYSSFDCSGLSCCNGVCQYSCYNDYVYTDYSAVPIIIGIVAGVGIFIFIVSLIIYFLCRRRRSNPNGGYIVTNPQGQVTAQYTQVPTYQPNGQPPPQQGYGAI